MRNLFWRGVARVVSIQWIVDILIRRAMKRPFSHLPSNDDPSYMARYWLFNPYPDSSKNRPRWQFPWSIRLHHIKRADNERDMHDHPWNARTIILRGGYTEQRLATDENRSEPFGRYATQHSRNAGDTATIGFEQYHRITHVSPGGVWTMFISGPWLGDWGFKVGDEKVYWRTYLAENAELPEQFAESESFDKLDLPEGSIAAIVYANENELVSSAMTLGPLARMMAMQPLLEDEEITRLAVMRSLDRQANFPKRQVFYGHAAFPSLIDGKPHFHTLNGEVDCPYCRKEEESDCNKCDPTDPEKKQP